MEVRNRFKGLDLIDRVPDELWTEVRVIVQKSGIKINPKKKKGKKAKWLSEEALQIALKRRESKSKGKKQRYTHTHTHTHTYIYADVVDVLFSDYIDAEARFESHCIWMSLKGTVIILLPHFQFLDNFSQHLSTLQNQNIKDRQNTL